MFQKFCLAFAVSVLCAHQASTQAYNPTILQDSRNEPKVDGTFGFLYRTEDGIAHGAKGDADGVVHGRFSYTDPTGLKVNYNYNAGSRVAPGYTYDNTPKGYEDDGSYKPELYSDVAQQYREPPAAPAQYREPPAAPATYTEPQQYRQSQPRPQPQPKYSQPPQQYRESENVYQPRNTRPPYARRNEVYDDYN